jgi:hypothetical protein
MQLSALIDEVLTDAIAESAAKKVPVYTFSLYFDHESAAISVCIDTRENSDRVAASINTYNTRHFHRSIADGDLAMAALWQAIVGRSLSIGDFTVVNSARREVEGIELNETLFLHMVRGLVARERDVLALAPSPESVVFACSGVNNEVAYVWSAASDA